jgi:hypothetical protein
MVRVAALVPVAPFGLDSLAEVPMRESAPQSPALSRSEKRGRALVMVWQYLGLFGHPQELASLATEWDVSSDRARLIVHRGRRLFLQQTGTIDDLPLSPHAKRGLRDRAAPFDPIVTLDQFRTILPRISDAELLRSPKIGPKTVAEIRRIWTSYAAQAR